MQIQIKGQLTIAQLRQALFEELVGVEENLAVAFSKGATLYLNPTNDRGDPVVPHNKYGLEVTKLLSNGPYKSAAEEFKI